MTRLSGSLAFELVIKQKPPYRLGIDMSLPHSRERTAPHGHRKWTEISLPTKGQAVPFVHDLVNLPFVTPDYSIVFSTNKHPLLIRQGECEP